MVHLGQLNKLLCVATGLTFPQALQPFPPCALRLTAVSHAQIKACVCAAQITCAGECVYCSREVS